MSADVDEEWRRFVDERKAEELAAIIEREALKPEETQAFMAAAFRDGSVQTEGVAIGRLLPPMPRFGSGAAARYVEKRAAVLDALLAYFERFSGLA